MSASPRGKGFRARRLADYVLRELDPLVAKQGFSEASLLMQWREIVGLRVAALCQPERLQWPPRPRGKPQEKKPQEKSAALRERPQEPATLILRVEPGFGLDIQHMAPTIIDRVNAHLGWRCVAKLALRQEKLADLAPKSGRKSPPPPSDPAAYARAAAATEGMQEPGLRAALTRLGESALAAKTPRSA